MSSSSSYSGRCSLNAGRCMICSQEGQWAGFTFNIAAITEFRSAEYFFGILGYTPFNTFLHNPCIDVSVNGGFKVAIS